MAKTGSRRILHVLNRLISGAFVFWVLGASALGATSGARHVLLITIDGCAAYFLNDPQAPIPTLRELAARGVVAEGMEVANPSVTWPNHTTLITGVYADQHSVLFNGVLTRMSNGAPARVDPRRDQAELIAVPTLLEAARRAGLRTAAINWPCMRNAPALDDNFPDVPEAVDHTTPRLRRELVVKGLLPDETDASFRALSSARKDQIWTEALCHVIRERKPHLMLLHILVTDGLHHRYGPKTPAGYTGLAQADAEVREVLRALADAGIAGQTAVFVVSDHGFATATKILRPNVLLRQAGWLQVGSNQQLQRVRAQVVPEGGTAMVYVDPPNQETVAQVRELFSGKEGIKSVKASVDFPQLGLPDPALNRQMADLLLVAEAGYAFNGDAGGDDYSIPVVVGVNNPGNHGYLASDPEMHAIFIAAGAGIKVGVRLGLLRNLDVAPTLAKLLGLPLPAARGKPLGLLVE